MTARLEPDLALVMAIWRRGNHDALLHHSDRGSQYTSEQFAKLISNHDHICSMSRSAMPGQCGDRKLLSSLKPQDRGAPTKPVSDA